MFKTLASAALVAATSAQEFIMIEEIMTLQTFNKSGDQPKCCENACTNEGEEKYYSVDRIHHKCGEACMAPDQFLKYKIFEPGLHKATTDRMCESLGYTSYYETETHGFANIKMTVDLYDKPAKNLALPPITPQAVGGFLAGLLDGFVVENDLSQIEACVQGAMPLEQDLAKALADVKDKNWSDAVEQLMAVAQAVPGELATCKSVTSDLSAVEAWAKGINKATVEKNLLLHHAKIEDDVKEVESDFNAGKYMDSGKAAADVIQLVAGPVHPSKKVAALPPITPQSAAGFVAGLLDGFVEENKLTEIEACYNGAKPLEADLAQALSDIKAKNWADAIQQLMAVAQAFPSELSTCESITSDLSAVATWAKGINKATVEKNLLLHHAKIEADVKEVGDDYTAGKYMDSGRAAADALIQVAGPVNPSKNVSLPPITPQSVGGFLAGLLDGFVEENKLSEIEACYNGGKPLEADLAQALADVKAKNWADAIQQLMAVAQAFPDELATCKSITSDLQAVATWAKGINKATVEKNLLLHHAKIEADVKEVEADYTAGKFMDSGRAAADALIQVAGPVNPSKKVAALPPITPQSAAGFLAGLLDGFVEENKLSEIEACYDGAKPLEADLAQALADVKAKNWADAVQQLMAVAQAFPSELATCKSVSTDLAAVATWAKGINKATVEKNLLLHHAKIEADVKEVGDDYTAGKYMDSGRAAADALILVAGPVNPTMVLH